MSTESRRIPGILLLSLLPSLSGALVSSICCSMILVTQRTRCGKTTRSKELG